ncbi:hypothetical protein BDN72DRAFT_902507 [Pluteus cervinus]|uniref:Uncharacterized protein n=1 Tax=Pluteus cervinus TaxID=181527 RepID=A0ACD3AD35_9AGAR|nr:hypothetical protein BDN72DRAFT_902507 [Pluteus cervinus]
MTYQHHPHPIPVGSQPWMGNRAKNLFVVLAFLALFAQTPWFAPRLAYIREVGSALTNSSFALMDGLQQVAILEERLRTLESQLFYSSRDGVARPDFASRYAGAQVLEYLTTETPIDFEPPYIALDDDLRVGRCWRLPQVSGQMGIRLPYPTKITHLSVDHIPRELFLVRMYIHRLLEPIPQRRGPSEGDLQAYTARWNLDNGATTPPCCTVATFAIDWAGTPRSPWNRSAARVFTNSIVVVANLEDTYKERQALMKAFFARVKSLKEQTPRRLPAKAKAARRAQRKNNVVHIISRRHITNIWTQLFWRRLDTCRALPALQSHVNIFERLGVDGMPSDDSEPDDPNVEIPIGRLPTLRILLSNGGRTLFRRSSIPSTWHMWLFACWSPILPWVEVPTHVFGTWTLQPFVTVQRERSFPISHGMPTESDGFSVAEMFSPRSALYMRRLIRFNTTTPSPETHVNSEVPPNELHNAPKPMAYPSSDSYLLRSAPTPIAPALVEYDTSRSASPVSTVTVHPPIALPRERQKLSRLIGEVEADSSEEGPLIKKLRSRRSNDGRDEGAVEGPADDDEPAEEPADDEEPTEEPVDDEAPVEGPVDDEEPEEPADDEEEMVEVDEAPAEGVATRGTKGGGSNSSERGSSNSEEDEDEDDEAEEDELDEDSDSSTRGIRWKGTREECRKAAKMYQDYLKSNKILSSAYKGLNNKSKQKFEGEYHLRSFIS